MYLSLHKRIEAFCSLGTAIGQALQKSSLPETIKLQELIESYHLTNPWFTPENIRQSLYAWSQLLSKKKITEWLSAYPQKDLAGPPVTILTIMAGNIPMVGFHDALSVLASGNQLLVKSSSKDPFLIKELLNILCHIEPLFRDMILYTDQNSLPVSFNAVLATGSDNSERHFHYLYGNYPMLIRNNRTSAALLSGDESDEELNALGSDIFSYFGLGCRSVTQLWLPREYDIEKLTKAFSEYNYIIDHHEYRQNYLYNNALMTLNKEEFIDTGFFLLKESNALFSPVSVVNYAFVNSDDPIYKAENISARLQVVTGKNHTPFGESQYPELWDYSDNLNTISFLAKIKNTL